MKTIQDKPVVVYAKNGCPFCIRTRDRLEKFVEIDEKETGNWIDVTGRGFPVFFLNPPSPLTREKLPSDKNSRSLCFSVLLHSG